MICGNGFAPDVLIDRLAGFARVIESVVRCFDQRDTLWKPDESSWSVLEIVCHLCDEEVEDFRTRVVMTLESPTRGWPAIDPQGWASARSYQTRDLDTQVELFLGLRTESIEILGSLKNPNWTRSHEHRVLGSMSAGQMLACWVDHDALHLRQLAKRLHQLSIRDGGGVSTEYAGTW